MALSPSSGTGRRPCEPLPGFLRGGKGRTAGGPGRGSPLLPFSKSKLLWTSLPPSLIPGPPHSPSSRLSSAGTTLPAATEPAPSQPCHLEVGGEGRLRDRGSTQQAKAMDSDLVIIAQLALSWPSHSSGLRGSRWRWASWACPSNGLWRSAICRSWDPGRCQSLTRSVPAS